MDRKEQDSRYEQLYRELLSQVTAIHDGNKKRIRRGTIMMILLPIILEVIRLMTGSDKVFFLVLWIIFMFILCAVLITVEYVDNTLQKYLNEVTDREAEFDALLASPEDITSMLQERASDRRIRRRETYAGRAESLRSRLALARPDNTAEDHEDEINLNEEEVEELVEEALTELSPDELKQIIESGGADAADEEGGDE